MRTLLLALLAATGIALLIYSRLDGPAWFGLLGKPLPVIALLLWLRQAPASSYRRWVSIGLVFSLLGDLLLEWPQDLFVFGLGAFLVAHLAYLVAYLGSTRRLAPVALLASVVVAGCMFGLLANAGLGALLIPVACYSLAIGCMLWRALARVGAASISRQSAWLAAGGALLFVLSDSLIGINRFVQPFEGARIAILATYWLGQWGIAASVIYLTAAARMPQFAGSAVESSASLR